MPVVQHSVWYTVTSWSRAIVVPADAARPRPRHLRPASLRCSCVRALLGALIISAPGASAVSAATTDQPEKPAEIVTLKSVKGKLDYVGSQCINLVYDRKEGMEYEMDLPYDKDLKLMNKRKLGDFVRGDIVQVMYEETAWTDEGGMERERRKATEIQFVRPAITGLRSDAPQ